MEIIKDKRMFLLKRVESSGGGKQLADKGTKDHLHHLVKDPLLFLGWNLIEFDSTSHD